MKQKLVFLRFGFLMSVFLFVLSSTDIQAQKNASRKAEKELFGKTGKSKPTDDKVRAKGAAGKAMKEQEKKEARRDREDEKNIEKLRNRHIEIQSTATQERMANNGKKTEASYKAKKQKQRKEQVKPELKQTSSRNRLRIRQSRNCKKPRSQTRRVNKGQSAKTKTTEGAKNQEVKNRIRRNSPN